MKRACPWCLEPLRSPPAAACPHCGRPLVAADGRELRPVDLRSEGVEARQCERYRRMLLVGTVTAAAVALIMGLLHVGAVAMAPLWAVLHLVVARLYLTGGAYRLLSRLRRRFTRWLGRLAFLWLGVPGYAAMAAPVLGVAAGAATFVVLTGAVHHYGLWSLRRERDRLPLAGWEKALLAVLAVVTLLALMLILVLALLLGWSVATLLRLVGSRTG